MYKTVQAHFSAFKAECSDGSLVVTTFLVKATHISVGH